MTSSVGIVGSSSAVVVPVTSAAVGRAPSALASVTSAPPLQNPRVVQDPSVGSITEYLSSNGSQVLSQIPSIRVVAYLREGLLPDGQPKQSSTSA